MKKIFFFTIAVALSAIGISSIHFKSATPFEPVVVLELFTSQGCSSCPPADQLLSQTIADARRKGQQVFPLSFHVDYWNRLGWTDQFSDKKYSQRQQEYAATIPGSSVYTPQLVVNGSSEFVGSDADNLSQALSASLKINSTAHFKMLTASYQDGDAPKIEYMLEGNFEDCKINFALVSKSEITAIKKGENDGRTLTNENVVRQFIVTPAAASGKINFEPAPLPAKNNTAIIAYIQQKRDQKIIGAAMAEIKE